MKVFLALLLIVAVSIAAGVTANKAQASDATRAIALNRQGERVANQMLNTLNRYPNCRGYRLTQPKVAQLGWILRELRYIGYPNRGAERRLRQIRGLGRQLNALCA